jgi:hypothetical protein
VWLIRYGRCSAGWQVDYDQDRKGTVGRFKITLATMTFLVGLVGVGQTPAMAQDGERYHDRYDRDHRYDRREDRRDRDYDRDRDWQGDRDWRRDDDWRRDRREWRRYDDERFERGERRDDAARGYYWVAPPVYAPTWRLEGYDSIYRGYDDRYYCHRSDGTTGLIVGGITGGVLGSIIAPGHSKTLGGILGAAGGAIVGRSIDRTNIVCR